MGIRREPEGAQMTRLTANPDLTTSHYTRVPGRGEGARKASSVLGRMHQPSPKEATMLRICTTAALIALTTSAAQADSLAQRIHDAAVKACAVETIPDASPLSLYGRINDQCVHRISRSTMSKYLAKNGEQAKIANK